MSLCEAIKKDGHKCKNKAKPKSGYCGIHKNHNKEKFILTLSLGEMSALLIQGYFYINRYNSTNDLIYLIKYIKTVVYRNNSLHNDFCCKCRIILKHLPPAKNINKFVYGGLVQTKLIELFNNIFKRCIDLDNNHEVGSEYKNDCNLQINNCISKDMSIKALKKEGKVTLINKNSNNHDYNLNDLITIVVLIENNDIIIIPHNMVDKKFIRDNDADISYTPGIFTYMYTNFPEYIIKLSQNENYTLFMQDKYNYLKPYDYMSDLSKNIDTIYKN